MLKDELRSLNVQRETELREKANERNAQEKEAAFTSMATLLKNAATAGCREVIVFSVPSYRKDLVDLSGHGWDEYEDPPEVIASAKYELRHLSQSTLRGLAAQIRDHLIAEGLHVTLRHRVEGKTPRSTHNVWDIVASW